MDRKNPFATWLQFQVAGMEMMSRSYGMWAEACSNVLNHQRRLLEGTSWARWHNVTPRGADLEDGYGKRHTDVDVKRI